MSAGDSDLSPHAYTLGILPEATSPAPSVMYYYISPMTALDLSLFCQPGSGFVPCV